VIIEDKSMKIAISILALVFPLLAACSGHPGLTQQKTTGYVAPYSVAAPAVDQQKTTTSTTTVHPGS
jgi:hypothetical protein